MKRKLQEKLFEKYSKLFKQKDLSMKETALCWGIETGDGWWGLINTLCDLIQFNVEKNAHSFPMVEFTQIKEKFGGLRIYHTTINRTRDEFKKILDEPSITKKEFEKEYKKHIKVCNGHSAYIEGMISFAVYLSQYICESCGSNNATLRTKGRYVTLCNKCYTK